MRYRHLWTEGDAACMQLIPALAPWVYSASRPFADWYFGDPDVAAEILHEWMSRPTAEVFVGRAIVMMGPETESETAGCLIALSGADLAKARAADFAAFCHELGAGPESEEVVAQVVPASRELFPPVADDELYISRVAVDPSRRGQGLGRKLVAHTMETFRAQGFRKFRLDVSADNRAAVRAYQAAGLRVVSTNHSPTSGLTYCAMVIEAEAAA
jgi:ribosomal protein S18 acetylase RimI-like enzyme